MKRKPSDELASRRSKRRSVVAAVVAEHPNDDDEEATHSDARGDADVQSSAASYVDSGAESSADSDDESTPATTITRAEDGADRAKSGPPSTSTARSRKVFPSMLKTIKCTHTGCNKTFNRPARLAAHLRSHTGDRAIRCPHEGCDKAYFDEKHLKQHIKGSHTGERQYVCQEPGCGKTFLTGTRLRRHAVVHSGQGRFPCTGHGPCDKVFRKHQTLQRHIRADHLGQPAFACTHDNCGAGFDTANTLRKHVQREHGELRFWCDECGKEDGEGGRRTGFTTMNLLMVHMRRCHVDCMFCDTRCGSQWELERHIEMHHSGSTAADRKVVACTWEGCDKKFTRRANLNVHIRMVHEGYRFVCGDVAFPDSPELAAAGWGETQGQAGCCGSGFHTKRRLEDHIRVTHLGLKRLAKTVREDDNDGDVVGLKPAGLFSMYASTAPGAWDDMEAGEFESPQNQGAASEHMPSATDFFCGDSGDFQAFGTSEEHDEHARHLHPCQGELGEQPDPALSLAWGQASALDHACTAAEASTHPADTTSAVDGTDEPIFAHTPAFEDHDLSRLDMLGANADIYSLENQAVGKMDDLSALVDPSLFFT